MYTMYARNPSMGGVTPGVTPVIQILKRGEAYYRVNLSNIRIVK